MARVKKKKLTRRDTENTYTPSENMSMEDIERIMSYDELKQYLQETQGYTGDISMGSYETYLKNKGVTTIPSAEVSTLSDESYNKLSDNQKQVYDAFYDAQTLPYELETKPPGRNINTVRKKDDIHWEDALRMVQDSGVKNIYNTPKDAKYKKGYKDGDFRAHASRSSNSIHIPPSSIYTGARDKRLKELELVKTLIEGFESGGGNYSQIDADGERRPVSQGRYNYYKNQRLPILLGGYENFYNNPDKQGMWYESGSLEDSSNFGVNDNYVSNLTAELAHVNRRKEQGLPTELADFYKTQGSRAVRAIKEGEWPDKSNYSTESDYEYQTHYAPTGNEATMFSEYNLSSKILRDLAKKKLTKEKSNGGMTTNPTDPKKSATASDSLNVAALKSGISQVESSGGQEIFMINPDPNSTATGLYGQRFSEIQDEYDGSRTEFSTDLEAQEEYMNKRIEQGINAPSLKRNAIDLTAEYKDQLGDNWDFTLNEVAALSHFLGRGGARKYFASIRDGEDYVVSGTNKTPEEYLEIFNEGESKVKNYGGYVRPIKKGDNGVTTKEGALSSLIDRMRDNRAKRRVARTNVKQSEMTDEELEQMMDMISSTTGGDRVPSAGYFNPATRTAEVDFDERFKPDDLNKPTDPNEILGHELIHSTQFGPLRQLAEKLGFNTAPRVQDPDIRKSFRKVKRSINQRDMGDGLSDYGNYMAGSRNQRGEYEAIMKTGITSALSQGVDLSGDFDSIARNLSQNAGSTNIRQLSDFMNNNNWDSNQKEIIMQAVRASKEFTPYNIEQTL